MNFRFIDRTNRWIDKLVGISWRESSSHANEVVFTRTTEEGDTTKAINDKSDSSEKYEGSTTPNSSQEGKTQTFEESQAMRGNKIVIAVDAGLVHLGDFIGGGIAFAIRGAAICLVGGQPEVVLRYNTGPILADYKNIVPALHYIGKRLGNEELYLDKLSDGSFVQKEQILSNANQIEDRYRNFVERMIQEEAIGIMIANKQGLLLIDGALPAGTYDTPVAYLQKMLEETVENRIDVAAISKKTRITVAGKPLGSLFDEKPAFVGYMPLTEILTVERSKLAEKGLARKTEDITLGNEIYAASCFPKKFCPIRTHGILIPKKELAMPKKLYPVQLSDEEYLQLRQYVEGGNKPARAINRARILLLADEHMSDEEILETLGVDRKTIYRVRKNYTEHGLEKALQENPRSGAPSKIEGRLDTTLPMLACSNPPEGSARWTLQLLADKLMELKAVDSISIETVRTMLKKTNLNLG